MSDPLTAALRQGKHRASFRSVERSNKRQKIQQAREEKVADAAAPLLKGEGTSQMPGKKKSSRETNLMDQTLLNPNILALALEYLDVKASQSSASVCKLFNSMSVQNKRTRAYALAFGKREWEKYFGDVGEVPPIPDALVGALHKECPYWSGKSVAETHLLTLIPKTVNGNPFTLNLLEELIQNLQGGGHATKYSYYDDDVQEALGNDSPGQSYWSLVTRGVIPNSRENIYSDQKDLLEGSYETPRVLEMATAILMHHARAGERLYPDEPYTYTRCQEQVRGGYRVSVGSFGALGLLVGNFGDSGRIDFVGLGARLS